MSKAKAIEIVKYEHELKMQTIQILRETPDDQL